MFEFCTEEIHHKHIIRNAIKLINIHQLRLCCALEQIQFFETNNFSTSSIFLHSLCMMLLTFISSKFHVHWDCVVLLLLFFFPFTSCIHLTESTTWKLFVVNSNLIQKMLEGRSNILIYSYLQCQSAIFFIFLNNRMKYVRIRCLDFHSIEMMRFKTIIYTLTEVSKEENKNDNIVEFLSLFWEYCISTQKKHTSCSNNSSNEDITNRFSFFITCISNNEFFQRI